MATACGSAVVKFGGSAITVKSEPLTVNWEALESLSEQAARYVASGGRLVVVHGGGSFGHYMVEKLTAERGRLGPLEVSEIQRSMMTLSLAVISSLVSKGVPAVVHPPHTFCAGEACDYSPIKRDLEAGLVPVTYGDGVLAGGRTIIISGDRLAAQVASFVRADCLVYASDVPGVLGPDGRPLRLVRPEDPIAELGVRGSDVTGGMRYKLREAASSTSRLVRIVHWRDVLRALQGEEVGTRVLP